MKKQEQNDYIFDNEDFMTTKILPPEILEFIFLELNLNDVRRCSQTCLRWKHIINSMFKDKGNLILLGLQ